MAWIETKGGTLRDSKAMFIANLDNVQYLVTNADYSGGCFLNARVSAERVLTIAESQDIEALNKLAVQIAQIARGNAYISQEDIRRMMDDTE